VEPEIGTDGSSETWLNPQIDWHESGFGMPRVRRSGVWSGLELNRPVDVIQSPIACRLLRSVANTIRESRVDCHSHVVE
jgi:hypothetical protein